jgi:amidase
MRIAVWADDPASPVTASVRAAVRRAAALLEGLGARVDHAARPFGFADAWIPFGLMSHAILALGLPPAMRADLAATAPGMDPADTSHVALRARAIALGPAAIEPLRDPARVAWARFFETHDALLCPPANVPAIPHDLAGAPFDRRIAVDGALRPYLDLMHWSAPASVADLPAVVAPVDRTDEGLPLGVQIIAARGADDTAIAIAAALEEAGCRAPAPT